MLLSFLFYLPVQAQISAEEKIDNYNVLMRVEKNGDLFVSERIDYNFGQLERHGIYRDIPISLIRNGKKIRLEFSNIAVTDENGKAHTFDTNKTKDNLQIKIGDPDIFITGNHSYIIDYRVKKPILFLQENDRLSWNAIGTSWLVPIERATVEIKFENLAENIVMDCFVGVFGSTTECERTQSSGLFTATNLEMREGMTIDIDFPKGIIAPPTQSEVFWNNFKHWSPILFPIIIFFLLFSLWKKHGKDPKGRGTIITQFDAPDSLTPAQVGVVFDEKAQNRDVWAELIFLATKGYLKIHKEGKEYRLERLKDGSDLTDGVAKKLFIALFEEKKEFQSLKKLVIDILKKDSDVPLQKESVLLSDLKYKFATDLQEIKTMLYNELVKKEYFVKNPEFIKGIYLAIGIVAFVLTGISFGFFVSTENIVLLVSLLLSAVLVMVFSPFMSKRTDKGVAAKEHILGLKIYLTVAEKDRINFHNAPEKNPATFEKFLPFAMALGVETEWAKQFKDLALTDPSWYSSGGTAHFSALALTSSLSDFSAFASSNLAVSQSSSGGGGFSGGGGGGGGGGSW